MGTMKRVQEVAWQQHNFPGRSPLCPLLGIVKEWGELESAETRPDELDAIGDVMAQTWMRVSKRDWRADPVRGKCA